MSEVPPPFVPSAPRRKDKTLMIILIILGVVLICGCGFAALGLFWGWGFVKKVAGPLAGCEINFQAARDAMLDYAKDHDGKLPKAETWQDDIRSYVAKRLKRNGDAEDAKKIIDAKIMSPDGDWGCYASKTRTTGMAFNSDLSGKALTDIPDSWGTPLLFEVESPKRNAAEKYKERPMTGSPTIMGQPRGWIWIASQGQPRGTEGSGFNSRGSFGDSNRWKDEGGKNPSNSDEGSE